MLSREDIIQQISNLEADWRERSQPRRSGYINPTGEDLAQEDGMRQAFAEAADYLQDIIRQAKPEAEPEEHPTLPSPR